MRLLDLHPQFIRYESRIDTWRCAEGDLATWRERGCPTISKTGPREYRPYVDSLAEAQGILFCCPKCFAETGSNVGVHLCEVTFESRGVPAEMGTHNKDGKSVRWNVSGDGFHNLTTTPSILLEGGCGWHGFITNGEAS